MGDSYAIPWKTQPTTQAWTPANPPQAAPPPKTTSQPKIYSAYHPSRNTNHTGRIKRNLKTIPKPNRISIQSVNNASDESSRIKITFQMWLSASLINQRVANHACLSSQLIRWTRLLQGRVSSSSSSRRCPSIWSYVCSHRCNRGLGPQSCRQKWWPRFRRGAPLYVNSPSTGS